jgi:hypothetical protein
MYNYKRMLGELFGVAIAVVWILFAFLGAGNFVFLAVAISLTILFGVLSGGFIRFSNEGINYKRLLGELFGAGIAIVWVCFALIAPGDMLFLVVAISLTILLGVLAGGLIKLSKKEI